jgi:hypothetical protein
MINKTKKGQIISQLVKLIVLGIVIAVIVIIIIQIKNGISGVWGLLI